MNILVVDDDATIRHGIKHLIASYAGGNAVVFEAENGLAALSMLYETKINLVFVDILMPVMDGIRLLEVAVPLFTYTAFVVISAYGEFEYALQAMRLGAVDYLLKPINPEELEEIVRLCPQQIEGGRKQHEAADSKASVPLLRADVLEALRLFVTKGIHTPYLDNDLPTTWKETLWHVIAVDTEDVLKFSPAALNRFGHQALANSKLQGYWLGGEPAIALIQQSEMDTCLSSLTSSGEDEQILLHVGISGIGQLTELYRCHREAKEALQYRLVAEGIIFYYNPQRGVPASAYDSLQHLFKRFQETSLTDIHTSAQEIIEEIVKISKPYPGSLFALMDRFCLSLTAVFARQEKDAADMLDIDELLDRLRLARSRRELVRGLQVFVELCKQAFHVPTVDYYNKVVDQAKQYIESRLSHDLSLEEVAKAVKMSKSHFSRIFHKVTCMNFIVYLTDLRLEEGKKLLQTRQYRVYEVAEKVGYSGWKHFSRLFRQKYGMSPSEFLGKK